MIAPCASSTQERGLVDGANFVSAIVDAVCEWHRRNSRASAHESLLSTIRRQHRAEPMLRITRLQEITDAIVPSTHNPRCLVTRDRLGVPRLFSSRRRATRQDGQRAMPSGKMAGGAMDKGKMGRCHGQGKMDGGAMDKGKMDGGAMDKGKMEAARWTKTRWMAARCRKAR